MCEQLVKQRDGYIVQLLLLMFRDSQEPVGELTAERKAQIQKEDNAR